MSETAQRDPKDRTHPGSEDPPAPPGTVTSASRSPSKEDEIVHKIRSGEEQPWDPEGEETEDDARRRLGLPSDAPRELMLAADGHELEDDDNQTAGQKEAAVLDFLLGPTTAIEYDIEALIETPSGPEKLVFHIKQLDDKTIEKLEKEHTEGEGPFARIDRRSLNIAKVAAATIYLEDREGRKVELNSQEFRGQIPDPASALGGRFRYQPGILSSVASEIDGVAGMANERVGVAMKSETQSAAQSMTEAAENS